MGTQHAPTGRDRPGRDGTTTPTARSTSGLTAGARSRPVDGMTAQSALALQRRAGNSAVATLLDRATTPIRGAASVQRNKLDPADDPQGYLNPAGKPIPGTGTTRIEVTGLKFGVKGGFAKSYGGTPISEEAMTSQSPTTWRS